MYLFGVNDLLHLLAGNKNQVGSVTRTRSTNFHMFSHKFANLYKK